MIASTLRSYSCDYVVRSVSNFTVLRSVHDQCTAEGVRGGTVVHSDLENTLQIRPGVQACFTDDDCLGTSTCDTASPSMSYSCGCHDGSDTCLAQGACVNICEREDIKQLLNVTAAMVRVSILHDGALFLTDSTSVPARLETTPP
jgi:coenzyme F420-reducing hydrogenase gamma subunit